MKGVHREAGAGSTRGQRSHLPEARHSYPRRTHLFKRSRWIRSSSVSTESDLAGLPPVRVHVGNDEVLLDDSVRFAERQSPQEWMHEVDVWEGMAHGFLGSVGSLGAPTESLNLIGEFLTERFAGAPIS
ncbi:MAG TPA: alpha/beta hydrolase fold domain-containing protein [Acidobacteriaceae bacterium]|nr:alpha/beta hydrolase fold domain-containing protein [Acidobacteriaceae bacterium]